MDAPVALITGAASGIGLQIATRLSHAGARIVLADVNVDAARSAALQLDPGGRTAIAVALDVTVQSQIAEAVRLTESTFGRLDTLVNSAGIASGGRVLEQDQGRFERMTAVNLVGTYGACVTVASLMRSRGWRGSIVNIASVAGRRGSAGRGAYGPTKAAVIALTRCMASEWACYGIRVNAIAPGPIETPLSAQAHSDSTRQVWLDALPMRRYGCADDIAEAALFLASDEARGITGHCLDVDGGFTGAGLLSFNA